MIFATKDAFDVNEEDLDSLVANKVSESRLLDYKINLDARTDAEKREFLADVSSFANTEGGYIIFGVKEESGLAKEIVGVDVENADQIILHLSNIIRDGLEPSLHDVNIGVLPLKNGRSIILIEIPRSWGAPHMVTFNKHRHFYGRHSAGKYLMDVHALRRSFSTSTDAIERLSSIRARRVDLIEKSETPLPIRQGPKVIIHLMPLSQNDKNTRISFKNFQNKLNYFHFMHWSIHNYKIGYDGLTIYSNNVNPDKISNAYTSVQQNGHIEVVEKLVSDNNAYYAQDYEKSIVDLLDKLQEFYKVEKIDLPFVVFISLIGVYNFTLIHEDIKWSLGDKAFDRNHILLPEILVHSYSSRPDEYLKSTFDLIWNSAGWPDSLNYQNGKWLYS
jgi:hypothetical protein